MDDHHKILVVDDETANLQKLRRTFVDRYPVLAAANGIEALEHVSREPDIAVIVADQRMPDMTGIELLQRTIGPLPHAIRIILTGFTEVEVLLEAINSCKVYRYMVKPWDPPDLLMTVERGLEAYQLAVQNEQYRKELIRRERLARELEIAGEIQRYILPRGFPNLRGYELGAEYQPAREVGGDLYDFDYHPAEELLQIVIGDVSGKSIPAALYGAVFSGHIRALLAQSPSPGAALAFLNASLIPRYQVQNHICVTFVRLNLAEGKGVVANAGMPYPFLVSGGRIERLKATGVPLGLIEDSKYTEREFQLGRGDLLVLISDGVSDVENPEGEMYEEERFEASLRIHAHKPVAECIHGLYADLGNFARTAEFQDDISLLALRRTF